MPFRNPLVMCALLLAATSPLRAQVAGDLDPSFGVGGKLQVDFDLSTDIAYGAALQADGKLLVAGTTYIDNDYSGEDFALTRHLADGTPDPSFGDNGRVTTNFPNLAAVASAVVVQPDGKIVVAGGAFPNFTFAGDFALVRFNPDGTQDGTFGNGGVVMTSFPGQGSYAFDVALQPDGKIVAAGTDFVNFSSSQSSDTDFALARYNPDGTLDSGFGVGGKVTTDFEGYNDDIYSILVQPDGKLVAVGSAIDLVDFYDFAAARYLPDGTLDAGFGVGGKVRTDLGHADFDQARSAALQADGKIVAAGFTMFNGGLSQPFALVRYTADGDIDSSFSGDGLQQIDFGSFMQAAYKVLVQPDGKIVTAGYANTESSDSDFLLARSNADGTLDTSFSGDGKVRTSFGDLNGGAYDVVLQSDGKLVAVGFNANFNQFGVEYALARYLADPSAWIAQGGALAGSFGPPVLAGTGTLVAGSPGSIGLSATVASAPAALFLASSSAPVTFKGGLLVAFPFFGQILAVTTPSGTLPLAFTVPSGIPSATEIWLQWAIQDAGAVQGIALSNAIKGVAP